MRGTSVWPRLLSRLARRAAPALVCAASTAALAADYVLTRPTAMYQSPPSGATQMHFASGGYATITLPFQFQYFGKLYGAVCVSVEGFVEFGQTPPPSFSHEGFPTTSGGFDGVCAPCWSYFAVGALGSTSPNDVFVWTTGAAPNRKWTASWENMSFNTSGTSHGTFQVQLYETTNVVVFAYGPDTVPTGWSQFEYSTGMDSPGDTRAIASNYTNQAFGYPGADQMFTPRTDVFSGTLLWDKIVSDASGVGNSTLANQPLAGVRVELRRDGGILVNAATTADDGSFSIPAAAVATTSSGALVATAANAGCVVSTKAGAAREWATGASLVFGSDANVGTYALSSSADAAGTLRAALNVAHVIGLVHDWAQARTSATIAQIPVVFDDAWTATTGYAATPSLVVGGVSAANYDGWDDAIVAKAYGRHVLRALAALPTTGADYRFDAVSDAQNAFAEGFGCYLWSAATGGVLAVDATGPTSATVFDLEHPAVTVAKGPDVAGCMAGALHDLLDPANETIDLVDGTTAPERVLQLVDAFAVAPTASTFLQAWIDAGYDAHAITRVFVGNGALADDAYEPNDTTDEAAPLGAVGFPPKTLVLNRFDEDWFSVTLPAGAAALSADATYDHASTGATAAVEIRGAGGALLATGTLIPATGAVHAMTGAVSAGSYKIRVRHVSGGTVPTYAFQVYVPPSMDANPLRDWTVGRAYDAALGVRDGIAPYVLSTPSSAMPPGMGLNSTTLHAAGTPSTVGAFVVSVQLRDGGSPANVVQCSQTVTIHDVFKIPVAPFVGFAAGRTTDATLPTHEGTPPFRLTASAGALPTGLAFDAGTFHVTGSAAAQPSVALSLDGVDVAGSADHVDLRAVVAVELSGKKAPASLVAGTDACGWWFDAVEGSTVSFAVSTAKKQPKRALTGMLLAPDRSLVATGTIKTKSGSLAASKLVCPQSGRYYFVASSSDAGAATQLLGTLAVAPPKSVKGAVKSFAPTSTTTFAFGALPGSTATVKFAGDRKAGLVAKVVAVLDPAGAPVNFAGDVKTSATGGTMTLPTPTGGTWTVVLGATSQSGVSGALTYSVSIKQAKGAVYVAP